jgi:cytoskeletal protein RodZ
MRHIAVFALVVAGIAVSLPAAAQAVYKSTMPDGRVIYGPQPQPGARKIDKVGAPPSSTGATAITPAEREAAAKSAKARADAQAGGGNDVAAARDALKAAEAARAAGQEPLPGERIGTAGGASRLTDEYFERQKKLAADVETAKRRLDEVQAKTR